MPFELTFADQFEDEIGAEGLLSVSYTANPERSGLPCGSGLYGPAGCSRRMVASLKTWAIFSDYIRSPAASTIRKDSAAQCTLREG